MVSVDVYFTSEIHPASLGFLLVGWLLLFILSSLFLTVVFISHVKTPPSPPPHDTGVRVCERARFERYICSPHVGIVCHSKEDHYMNILAPVEIVVPPTPISIDRTDRGFWGRDTPIAVALNGVYRSSINTAHQDRDLVHPYRCRSQRDSYFGIRSTPVLPQ